MKIYTITDRIDARILIGLKTGIVIFQFQLFD